MIFALFCTCVGTFIGLQTGVDPKISLAWCLGISLILSTIVFYYLASIMYDDNKEKVPTKNWMLMTDQERRKKNLLSKDERIMRNIKLISVIIFMSALVPLFGNIEIPKRFPSVFLDIERIAEVMMVVTIVSILIVFIYDTIHVINKARK